MKMTLPMGRTVSLCVALVYGVLQFSVGNTESHQGASVFSSQKINAEETSPHLKNEEDQIPVERVGPQHANVMASEFEHFAEENQEADDGVAQLEETSINHQPAADNIQDQNAISGDFTPNLHDHETLNSEDDMINSESEPTASEDTDQPPSSLETENPYNSDNSPPLVLDNIANAHTTGTKSHLEPSLSPPATPSTKYPEVNPSNKQTEPDIKAPVTTHIITFDEWKRNIMEDQKQTVSIHSSNTAGSKARMKVQKNFKNYASVECGARILGANPEAKRTSGILSEDMDFYMLSACHYKKWFIVELCEPITLRLFHIANLELFSSNPNIFIVFLSDGYPTNKWRKLGTFQGSNERTVQRFPLDQPHLRAKYVKVEFVSHCGCEYYCPISVLRVFGTSMIEEYDEEGNPSERHDDSDDDWDGDVSTPGDASLSLYLIRSAKDAILNMVNSISVNVLGVNTQTQDNPSQQEVKESEPSPSLQIPAETNTEELTVIPDQEDVKSSSDIVIPLEKDEEEPTTPIVILLDEEDDEEEEEDESKTINEQIQEEQSSCCVAVSLHEYLLQKCSALQPEKWKCQTVKETQTITPTQTIPKSEYSNCPLERKDQPAGDTVAPKTPELPVESMTVSVLIEPSKTAILLQTSAPDPPSAKHTDYLETSSLPLKEPDRDTESIENQKTVNVEKGSEPSEDGSPLAKDKKTIIDGEHVETSTVDQTLDLSDQTPNPLVDTVSPNVDPESVLDGDSSSMEASQHLSPAQASEVEPPDLHSTITDAQKEEPTEDSPPSSESNGSPPPQTSSTTASASGSDLHTEASNNGSNQKESVFMRLNNRINALEVNMSLSGRYLEQLSQWNRKQMEDVQKAFNKTTIKMEKNSKMADEKDQSQNESVQLLQDQMKNITQLVLNLSLSVSQIEMVNQQNSLLFYLLLCIFCGCLLCAYNCWMFSTRPMAKCEPPIPTNYTTYCSERDFSCHELTLKRSASYPLIHSESLQLDSTEGLERIHSEEILSVCHRKKRRHKMKSMLNADTLHPSLDSAGQLCNTAVVCNGGPITRYPPPHTEGLLQPSFRDSPSEVSSEASSHSDEPWFCGLTTAACSGFCDSLPVARSRAHKRRRQRRPKGSAASAAGFLKTHH